MQNVQAEVDAETKEMKDVRNLRDFGFDSDSLYVKTVNEFQRKTVIESMSTRHKQLLSEIENLRASLKTKDLNILKMQALISDVEEESKVLKSEVWNIQYNESYVFS